MIKHKFTGILFLLLWSVIAINAQERVFPPERVESKNRINRYLDRKLAEKDSVYANRENFIFDGAGSNTVLAERLSSDKLSVKYSINDRYAYERMEQNIFRENFADGTITIIARINKEPDKTITFLSANENDPEQNGDIIGMYNGDTQQIIDRDYNVVGKIITMNSSYRIAGENGNTLLLVGDISHELAIFFFLYDYLPYKNSLEPVKANKR